MSGSARCPGGGVPIRISPSGNRRAALPAAPAIADPQAARVRRGLAA